MSSVPTLRTAEAGAALARLALPVFVSAIGLSAFLLFAVQPLFAKLVLPVLGGSPAVWSVATVVFQCLLLAGYAYAHALAGRPGASGILIHLGVLCLAAWALPIGLASGWGQPPAGLEAPWLAAFILVSVGLPFFALSANGPLLQAWFARSGHRQAGDPYFLYAASNIGSLAALAAYPLLVEPALRLRDQIEAWSIGFAALVVLIGAAGALTVGRISTTAVAEAAEARRTTWRDRLVWIGLAAVPSGLLVAVTAHISTDIAPMPLLWIVPLAVYLLTFIVAFRPSGWLDDRRLVLVRTGLTAIALVGLGTTGSLELGLAVHLGLFTLTALVCHRMLYVRRPASRELTGFYLSISAGGALGGLFCGILGPLLFNTLAEYPIFLVAALACRPDLCEEGKGPVRPASIAGAICLAAFAVTIAAASLGVSGEAALRILMIGLAAYALVCWRSAGTSTVAMAAIALLGSWPILPGAIRGESVRSFFGVHRIETVLDGRFRILTHGTTIHGAVRIRNDDGTAPTGRPEPTTYFTYEGVIGRAVAAVRAARGGRLGQVSAVGLGTGSLACHRVPGETWTFYEIDAAVLRLAEERFPFLTGCGEGIATVIGDARLTLGDAAAGQDLVVLDAFSSDSIPVHLLTSEAIGLYLSKLGPQGVVVMHISNRHLDLARVLARTAAERGLVTFVGADTNDEPVSKRMRAAAKVVVLARDPADVGAIAQDPTWRRLEPDMARRPWTDDFSNVLEALRDGRNPVERDAR